MNNSVEFTLDWCLDVAWDNYRAIQECLQYHLEHLQYVEEALENLEIAMEGATPDEIVCLKVLKKLFNSFWVNAAKGYWGNWRIICASQTLIIT